MIAAIYARKSTEQHGADADAKSVARQIENARAFAMTKGWSVADALVYADNAISGAETARLVNRQRLLDAIHSRPKFGVLIMRDASRFSRRDGDEAFGELKRIAKAGVAIWFYQDGTQFEYGNFAANITGIVRAEMNAEFRRQIGKWTREAMVRKATAGHVTGGRVFGYDNLKVDGHVERRINDPQAAVVRQIFDLSAAGTGYTRIAKQLNAERAPAPRPQQQRPSGWSPSTVYEVLHRPLYRGEVVWNKTRKRDPEGKTNAMPRPESEWLRLDRPELRIVSEKTWQAVHARLRGRRTILATAGGRPRQLHDIDSKYLLSGFARCATCGGTLATLSRDHGKGRAFFYGCLAHAKRGATVCNNALVLPVDRVDRAVLSKLSKDVLRPAVVKAIIEGVFKALQPKTVTANVGALRAELRALDKKIGNLTEAIEGGAAVAPLVAKLQARQAERDDLLAAIGAADALRQVAVDRESVERRVFEQVKTWQALLTTKVPDARQALREMLDGPIRFAPEGREYRFSGNDTTGKLVAGLVGLPTPPSVASPAGFEPALPA